MDSPSSPLLTEDEIHTLLDGLASPQVLASLQARLVHDPDAQAKMLKWQHQRTALCGLYQQVLDEPVPATLMRAAQQAEASQQTLTQWWRWGGMAASVLLAFGAGWLSNGQLPAQPASGLQAQVQPGQDFARQASYAHKVYSPEIRHPVEVTAAEQEHLVQWLSKRVGRPLKIPQLGPLGYELVGGRLLPGEAGARAQFMYQNVAGTRITLYLGALDQGASGAPTQETGFHLGTGGPVPNFYWMDQGFGYALAGPVPRDTLMQLAEAVYRQL